MQDTRRLVVAIDCFVAHGKDSQPLVDALLGVGTCQEWLRLSSKQRLIERYKELRNAREPADQKLREFCRLYLASKHAFDVDEELRKAAEATRKQEAEEDRRHEQQRQARELAADAMRQSQAMDAMIRAAEAGYYNRPVPAVRSDLEW